MGSMMPEQYPFRPHWRRNKVAAIAVERHRQFPNPSLMTGPARRRASVAQDWLRQGCFQGPLEPTGRPVQIADVQGLPARRPPG